MRELLPDQPDRNNPGVIQADNVLPYANAYRPVKAFVADTNALDSDCRGGASLIDGDGTVYNYAADDTKVYTRTGNTYSSIATGYSLGAANRWEFDSYFDKVLAVNGVNKVQYASFGASLSDAHANAPIASHLAVSRNVTIVGNLPTDVAGVAWSAIGDPTDWTGTEAGSQHLDGAEKISRIFGGEYATVLCQRGIYRMSFVGPPAYWQFDNVESERGCFHPGLAVQVGFNVYYLDSEGFFVFNGSRAIPISSEKLSTTFYDAFDAEASHLCSSIADIEHNLIWIAYPGAGHTGTANEIMIYNYQTNQWSGPIRQTVQQLLYSRSDAVYVDDFTTETVDTAPDPGDNTVDGTDYTGGVDPRVSAFITGNYHALQEGSKLTALIESGEYQFNNGRTLVSGFRPIVEGDSPVIRCAVDSRNSTSGPVIRNSLKIPLSRTGITNQRVDAYYHRFRLEVSGDYDAILDGEPIIAGDSPR